MKILVVDDEALVRTSLCNWIRQADTDFIVQEARHGLHAQALVKEELFDLIITDVRMPGMDGIALIRWLKEEQYPSPVVLLTGYAEFEYALQAIRSGVYDYLLKPASKTHILRIIQTLRAELKARQQAERLDTLQRRELLEKRLQDVLNDFPFPYYDRELLPPFSLMHMYTVFATSKLEAPLPYFAKKMLEESFDLLQHCVVLHQQPHFVVLVFTQEQEQGQEKGDTVLSLATEATGHPLDGAFQDAIAQLEAWIKHPLIANYAGATETLEELGLLYLASYNRAFGKQAVSVEAEALVPAPASDIQAVEAPQSPHPHYHRLVTESLEVIRKEYAHVSLNEVADRFYVNPNYLGRLIKAQTQLTFSQHMINARLEAAKRLLVETNEKIYAICEQVGYAEQAYFSRLFKTMEGMTPYAYRDYVRSGQNM